MVKKLENMFSRFDAVHERDGHQARQTIEVQTDTARQHRPRLHASRDKMRRSDTMLSTGCTASANGVISK